jgi:hypothetical protein
MLNVPHFGDRESIYYDNVIKPDQYARDMTIILADGWDPSSRNATAV